MRSLGRIVLAVAWLAAVAGCHDDNRGTDASRPPPPCSAIPGTSLCWRVPATWQVAAAPAPAIQEPRSASGPASQAADSALAGGVTLDHTQLVASGERQRSGSNSAVLPRVEVYRDSALPASVTPTDYLVANRMSQKRALGEIAVRHLEVEPIRRDNRRGFHLRDAFDVPLPQGGRAPVSQQALIVIDGQTGYVVAVTLMEDERALLAEEIRAWLGSVSFVGGGETNR